MLATRWSVRTPAVVPVGPLTTSGSLTVEDLLNCGARALGVDWLRLYLRPGVEVIESLGGLPSLDWPGPLITGPTDWAHTSGSAAQVRATEAMVVSPSDGSTRRLTPEAAIEAQVALGLDVAAVFGWPEVVARGAEGPEALRRRLIWAERSLAARPERAMLLCGLPLSSSAETIRELRCLPFDGYVIEALHRAPGPSRAAALRDVLAELPAAALRVIDWTPELGSEGLEEILSAGVDLVRVTGESERARAGRVLTSLGEISATTDAWTDDAGPLEPGCACPTCSQFSRAYVRHLFEASELLGPRLVEMHNVAKLARAVHAAGQ